MRSIEDKLLIACARTTLNDKSVHEIKNIINSALNWEYVIRNASRHSIASLLYKNIKNIGVENKIPEEVFNKLREHYYLTIVGNTHRYKNFSRVYKIFNDAGIKVVVLKGAVLAENVYQNIGLRPFCDIDIMVRFDGKNGDKAQDVLKVNNEFVRFVKEDETKAKTVIKADLENDWLDVHYETLRGRDIEINAADTRELWERAIPAKVCDMNVLSLCPEHQLLHLIIHGDYFLRLGWLCDIAELVRRYRETLNWQNVVNDAKRYGYENLYFFQLYSAREMLDAPVPDEALKVLQPNRVKVRLIDRLIDEWKPEQPETTILNLSKPFKVHLLESLTFSRAEHILEILNKVFLPEAQWIKEHYPVSNSKTLYFYYCLHFFVVPLKGIKGLLSFFYRR